MEVGHHLEFHCVSCDKGIEFSVLKGGNGSVPLTCSGCGKRYSFDDATMLKQLRQFEALCRQIHASQEILGQAQVGITVGGHEVRIPYKILLTRLNSMLELKIGDKAVNIQFRVEPAKDLALANS